VLELALERNHSATCDRSFGAMGWRCTSTRIAPARSAAVQVDLWTSSRSSIGKPGRNRSGLPDYLNSTAVDARPVVSSTGPNSTSTPTAQAGSGQRPLREHAHQAQGTGLTKRRTAKVRRPWPSAETYLPAAGCDWFLPIYDPYVKLLGWTPSAARCWNRWISRPASASRHWLRDRHVGRGRQAASSRRRGGRFSIQDPRALARAARKALGADDRSDA